MLVTIGGGADLTLFEVDEIVGRIGEDVRSDTNIIFGADPPKRAPPRAPRPPHTHLRLAQAPRTARSSRGACACR